MPLKYELQPENNLIIIRVIESFTLDDFHATMPAILHDPDFISGMNSLWDVRQGTLSTLSGNDIHMIAEYISSNQSERGTDYKIALVVSTELDSSLSRLYDVFTKCQPNLCSEFRDYDQALAWLSE